MQDWDQEAITYSFNKYLLNSYYVPGKKEENEQKRTGWPKILEGRRKFPWSDLILIK